MQTRMLDISNTAAAMIDGDALKSVSPADEGTDKYESIMRTLRYFQDNIDLKYIYCIRDMGDGKFTFGLDPTVEDPGEFGSPIVYTDALYEASQGHPAADNVHYEDAWGAFYSAYSPVFDSEGKVAGIIAVDFSAEWYNQQLAEGTLSEFGLVICDVNGLKIINDTNGHQAGDEYIRQACKMVCDIFSHSPVYRIGGDEFAVILTGRDYKSREVLMQMQVYEDFASIPVIVLTVDEGAQLDCLRYGAMDFIPKPYPDIEIVKARIAKCIELSENRNLIRQTQRDKLTGQFYVDYFMRYVDRFDHLYENAILDAVACNVNGLHSINRHHGRQFGDFVLQTLGISLRKLARRIGGMGCGQTGDAFLLYCPHQEDYEQLLHELLLDVFSNEEFSDELSIRFGVFANARQEPSIEERFVCAKIAAEKVRDDS
ncbi:MAG: diguanylate cyclase, partial [Atopobiaceae bacterium]|nr:diguanylate cyclase [Atopobiaceae bacterium]